MADAAQKLKEKYEQLRKKKKLAESGGKSNDAGGGDRAVVASAGGSGVRTGGAEGFAPGKNGKNPRKEACPDEDQAISVAQLDPSTIQKLKTSTAHASIGSLSQQSAPKRPKLGSLPSIPKRAADSVPEQSDATQPADAVTENETISGVAASPGELGEATRPRPTTSAPAESVGEGETVDGFAPEVHAALERVKRERKLEVEDKLMQALRALKPATALRVLEQFENEDMNRIRNQGAYLWGIVRKLKDGRAKLPFSSPYAGRDATMAPLSGGSKLLWPEEERAIADAGGTEGKLIERECAFDNISCSLPAAESLYSEAASQSSTFGELASIRKTMQEVTQHVEGIDAGEWSKASSQVALSGRVVQIVRQLCKPELCTSEWAQMYELLGAYAIVPQACIAEEKLRSLHLCEASGAGICALNHFLRTRAGPSIAWDWLAHRRTSQAESDSKALQSPGKARLGGEDDRFLRETNEHWVLGADGSGDLTDRKGIEHFWQCKAVREKGRFHVATVDHAELPPSTSWDADQEAARAQGLLGQALAAMGVLDKGGSLVLRAWTVLEHTGVGVVFLLNCVFDEVVACRPVTLTAGTPELFYVCLGFKGLSQAHMQALLAVAGPEPPSQDGQPLTMIPQGFLPSPWMRQMQQCSQIFAKLQEKMLERDLRLYTSLLPAERSQIFNMRDQVAQQWKTRFDCRALASVQDRIVKGGLATAAQHKLTASPGGKHWYSIRGRFIAPSAKA